MKPNYETCQHAVSVGAVAVYVTPACPNYHKIKGSWRLRSAAVRYVITEGDEMTTKGKAFRKEPYNSRRYPAHCYTCEYQVNAETMSNKDGVPKVIG